MKALPGAERVMEQKQAEQPEFCKNPEEREYLNADSEIEWKVGNNSRDIDQYNSAEYGLQLVTYLTKVWHIETAMLKRVVKSQHDMHVTGYCHSYPDAHLLPRTFL